MISFASARASCTMLYGDGIGDSEIYVGKTDTALKCAELVFLTQPQANGATYGGVEGTSCFAEFGMYKVNPASKQWATCHFNDL